MNAALAGATLWITVVRSNADGRRCRDYTVRDPDGAVLLTARAFVWDRALTVTDPASGRPFLRLKRRLSFPLTGRVDVLGGDAQRHGAVHRNGSFTSRDGRCAGRFRDARRLRTRAAEGVLAGLADAVLGGESSQLSSPTAFVCTVAEQRAGSLALTRAPWPAEVPPPELRSWRAWARGILPARALRALRQVSAPTAWKFERAPVLLVCEPQLTIGAALFQVELAQW